MPTGWIILGILIAMGYTFYLTILQQQLKKTPLDENAKATLDKWKSRSIWIWTIAFAVSGYGVYSLLQSWEYAIGSDGFVMYELGKPGEKNTRWRENQISRRLYNTMRSQNLNPDQKGYVLEKIMEYDNYLQRGGRPMKLSEFIVRAP